jgi:cobalamin biosynthetic protein CobC
MDSPISEKIEPVILHGGNLARARSLFPQAPAPWIDLSTGINPISYPHSPIPAEAFSRLPEPALAEILRERAARAYGARSAAHVAAAPGTQILLPLVSELAKKSAKPKAVILSPTYAEHARAARLNGFDVIETDDFATLSTADLAIVVNPNNPTGRVISKSDLLALATALKEKGGMLIVDEAFGDAGDGYESLCGDVDQDGIVVLRSFGKFYGMAGLRLGFAVATPQTAGLLESRLGPWAISGPALHIATEALSDKHWQVDMRLHLRQKSERLDEVLYAAGLTVSGGTNLFRLVRHENAANIFSHLGEHGILVRAFEERQQDLRFGLPGRQEEWQRLRDALKGM